MGPSSSGPGGIRTRDLISAIDARSQLRYRPFLGVWIVLERRIHCQDNVFVLDTFGIRDSPTAIILLKAIFYQAKASHGMQMSTIELYVEVMPNNVYLTEE